MAPWTKESYKGLARLVTGDELVGKFFARLDVGSPELDAGGMVHRPLANDLGEEEVGDLLDLARLQRGGRIGHRGAELLQVSLLHPIASAIAVCETIEGGHRLAGYAAFDRHDQLGAIQLRRAQVGAVRHLAVHLAAVGSPPVTRLAVGLLPVDPQACGDVFWRRRRLRARRRGSEDARRTDDEQEG
jgi:hypothetical protein